MKKYLLCVLLLLPNFASAADYDSLVVRGEGEIHIKPEILRLDIQIVGKAKTAKAAQTMNAEETAKVNGILKQMHIAEKDMQTMNYSVDASYDYTKGKRILTGYAANHSLQVTVRNLEQASPLMDALVDSQDGDNKSITVSSSHYDTEKMRDYERDALTAAMTNAKQRAEVLARAAGKNLKEVRHISDSQINLRNPAPMGLARRAMFAAADASAAPELSAGEIIVTSSVTVEYSF